MDFSRNNAYKNALIFISIRMEFANHAKILALSVMKLVASAVRMRPIILRTRTVFLNASTSIKITKQCNARNAKALVLHAHGQIPV